MARVPDKEWGSPAGVLGRTKIGWKKILKKESGIKGLRIHDLRRTLGSWQAATGANTYMIGGSLGHKSSQSTAIYARLHLDPIRASVEKATEAMLQTLQQDKIRDLE